MKKVVELSTEDREYEVNGVKYIDSSSFKTHRARAPQSIRERFENVLKEHFDFLYHKFGYDINEEDKKWKK